MEPQTVEITSPDGSVVRIDGVTGFRAELNTRHLDFLAVTTEHGWNLPDRLHLAPIGSHLALHASDTNPAGGAS